MTESKAKPVVAWQWILRDNQETCYPCYILTRKFFSSREEVEAYYKVGLVEATYSIIGPFEMSEISGDIAEVLLKDRMYTKDDFRG